MEREAKEMPLHLERCHLERCRITPPEVFLFSFRDDKTSAPDVFSSCSFILRTHFETSLVMISFNGYEIMTL